MVFRYCDNDGENVDFERVYKWERIRMEFKYTAPGIPQQAGLVEWKVATLFNRVCAMLNGRKFPLFLRKSIQAKAYNTATLLENNLVTPNRDSSPFQQLSGKGKRSILS